MGDFLLLYVALWRDLDLGEEHLGDPSMIGEGAPRQLAVRRAPRPSSICLPVVSPLFASRFVFLKSFFLFFFCLLVFGVLPRCSSPCEGHVN